MYCCQEVLVYILHIFTVRQPVQLKAITHTGIFLAHCAPSRENAPMRHVAWLLRLVAVVLVVLILAITNPSRERHQQAIRDVITHDHPIASLFGLGRIASRLPEYHSFGFFSYTTADEDVVSIGAVGYVWVKNLKAL